MLMASRVTDAAEGGAPSMGSFEATLAQLWGIHCEAVDAVEYDEGPKDTVDAVGTSLRFADGTKLQAQFWRLGKKGKPLVSIFDHRQKYGLPEPIDAIGVLKEELVGKPIVEATMNRTTGDLHFEFGGDLVLEVFNFTAYEIWQMTFADGSVEYSNYALASR
jgi:hypothetical protein